MNSRIVDLLPWCFLLFVFGVSFSIVAAHITLGLWLLLWLVSLALKQTHWKRTPLDMPVLIFLGVDLITAILGVNPKGSLVHFVSLWHMAIYLLVVNTITDRRWIERSLVVLLVAVGLNASYGIVQHFWDGMYFFRNIEETARWSIENRELGTFGHSMTFAGQMTLVGLMGLSILIWWKKFPGMLWWGIPVAVIFFAWVFSYTRGAWVGGVAGMIALGALKGKRAVVGICLGLTLLVVLVSSFEENFLSRIKSIADPNNHSNFTRINMLKVTYEMFKESPVFGVGSGNYGEVSEPYRLRYEVANSSHPHNNLLTQVAEKGLLGLSAFLCPGINRSHLLGSLTI